MSDRLKRILFTGGGGAGTELILKQWHDRYDLLFGDAAIENIPSAIPASRRVALPFAREPDFAERVFAIAKDLSVDLIVPGVDEELPLLAKRSSRASVPLMLPGLEFVQGMLDKLKGAQLIRAAGLTVPDTLPLEQAHQLQFPIIAKPRSGRGSQGVMTLSSIDQVSPYATLQGARQRSSLIAQQLITGQEYTVFVSADSKGKLAAIIPIKVLLKRGVTIRAETEAQPQIIDYVRRLHEHFGPPGLYNVQLMLTANGGVYPFEVNPRISTTFCLAISTGFDPIAAFFEGRSTPVFVPDRRFSLRRSWLNTIEAL